jgi:hypothetical protein
MGLLSRFEGRLRGAVEGAAARTFKEPVEPVEIAGAIAREIDNRKAVGPVRTLAPNTFCVELSPDDYDRLSPYAQPLGAELATMAEEHAHKQRYAFVGPVSVGFEEAPDIATGLFRIRSQVTEGETKDEPTREAPSNNTIIMRATPEPPRQLTGQLTIKLSGQPDRVVPIGESAVLIGRGSDADIALSDSSVSRRHGEVTVVDGGHRYTDLGSTNGSTLAGRPISHADLADGDRLTLGNVTVIYNRT